MNQDKRLEKLAGSLTPKQAVILWMQEAHQYDNLREYVRFLKDQPEGAAPITRLSDQIDRSVRQAMRGQRKPIIVDAAVRRELRDLLFLFHLHKRVNTFFMDEQRAWDPLKAALAEGVHGMVVESLLRDLMVENAYCVNFETSYPLDPDTAAAVGAAIRHHVTTWEQLDEEGTLVDWLFNHLVAEGATELPENSYEFRDGKWCPRLEPDNEKEVRACFKEDAEFEKFRSGEDYSYGLASITDAEFNAHHESMVAAIHQLVDSGKVQSGVVVHLETVPVPCLQEASLVEGEWLDRYIAELAEWGILLRGKGYGLRQEENAHLLATVAFDPTDKKDADQPDIQALRRRATHNMAKFPGRTKKVEGRLHLRFEDYRTSRGRKAKVDRRSGVKKGLVTTSWNQWIGSQDGGVATLTGVPVASLGCYMKGYSYHTGSDVAEEIRQREQLLESMRGWRQKPERQAQMAQNWKNTFEMFLGELYAFQQAVASISQRYFDGHDVLFPDPARELAEVVGGTEAIVADLKQELERTGQQVVIDLEAMRKGSGKDAAHRIDYLVDMAKAEALDRLGEQRAAIDLAVRHL